MPRIKRSFDHFHASLIPRRPRKKDTKKFAVFGRMSSLDLRRAFDFHQRWSTSLIAELWETSTPQQAAAGGRIRISRWICWVWGRGTRLSLQVMFRGCGKFDVQEMAMIIRKMRFWWSFFKSWCIWLELLVFIFWVKGYDFCFFIILS